MYRFELEVLLDVHGASAKFTVETQAGNERAARHQVKRLVEDGMMVLSLEREAAELRAKLEDDE